MENLLEYNFKLPIIYLSYVDAAYIETRGKACSIVTRELEKYYERAIDMTKEDSISKLSPDLFYETFIGYYSSLLKNNIVLKSTKGKTITYRFWLDFHILCKSTDDPRAIVDDIHQAEHIQEGFDFYSEKFGPDTLIGLTQILIFNDMSPYIYPLFTSDLK